MLQSHDLFTSGIVMGLLLAFTAGVVAAETDRERVQYRDPEPWVEEARVGDFIVQRQHGARLRRQEVVAITAEGVMVRYSEAQEGTANGRLLGMQCFRFAEAPAAARRATAPPPRIMATQASRIAVDGRDMECQLVVEMHCITSDSDGRFEIRNCARAYRWSAPEVPFGGTIRLKTCFQPKLKLSGGRVAGWKALPPEPGLQIYLSPAEPSLTVYDVERFGRGSPSTR